MAGLEARASLNANCRGKVPWLMGRMRGSSPSEIRCSVVSWSSLFRAKREPEESANATRGGTVAFTIKETKEEKHVKKEVLFISDRGPLMRNRKGVDQPKGSSEVHRSTL